MENVHTSCVLYIKLMSVFQYFFANATQQGVSLVWPVLDIGLVCPSISATDNNDTEVEAPPPLTTLFLLPQSIILSKVQLSFSWAKWYRTHYQVHFMHRCTNTPMSIRCAHSHTPNCSQLKWLKGFFFSIHPQVSQKLETTKGRSKKTLHRQRVWKAHNRDPLLTMFLKTLLHCACSCGLDWLDMFSVMRQLLLRIDAIWKTIVLKWWHLR